MSLTDLLDLVGSLLLIVAACIVVSTYLGVAAGISLAGALILVLSWGIGRIAARKDDGK